VVVPYRRTRLGRVPVEVTVMQLASLDPGAMPLMESIAVPLSLSPIATVPVAKVLAALPLVPVNAEKVPLTASTRVRADSTKPLATAFAPVRRIRVLRPPLQLSGA
jgi:hypothetical protein